MVSVQADCSINAAFAMIQHRALDHGWSVDQVAAAVIDRRIRFAPSNE
jgi:AmiR/NasT family two-component response regulator